MAQTAAETASSITCVIAAEQHFPAEQRILNDPLAGALLPLAMRAFVRMVRSPRARDGFVGVMEKLLPGLWSGLLCRKRFIDEAVIAAAKRGLDVVILGAGLDTRAYRLEALCDTKVWELDQRENVEHKQRRLERVLGAVPPGRTLVSVDFSTDDVAARLAQHGCRLDRPSLFVVEAVSQYLTESAVHALLDMLSRAAAGSQLVFTYVRRAFMAGAVAEAGELAHDELVKTQTWTFGLDPASAESLLGRYGWRTTVDVGTDALADRFVAPTGRALTPSTVERILLADRR